MAPLVPSAKVTLSYPLYACDFDPLDSSRLVVGGGGGAGRTGVGNTITVFDTTNPNELEQIAEIDLSKDEDNVTSLAVGAPKGKATLIYAGANSSPMDLEKGKNEHFRVLGIETAATVKISEVSRSKLFSKIEKDSYQRIVRLSKPYSDQPQLGAVATGLAKDSEIVLFETGLSPPRTRGALQSNRETVDVDFIQTGDKKYLFAYCDDYDLYTKEIASVDDGSAPEERYTTPESREGGKLSLPKFRALRWLTKDFFVTLTNIQSNGGVVLQVFRMPLNSQGHCKCVQSHQLPYGISKATGLAIVNLTPPLTPSAEQGYTQFVFAVAGHDRSISLFKMDLQYAAKVYLTTKIKPFRTLKDVHPLQITGIAFSNFTPPAHPITASTPPQYLKLASVGVSNTVVVHTLPLFPVPLSVKRGQSKTPRYVVALPSSAAVFGFGVVVSIFAAIMGAVIVQAILEIRGGVKPFLNATSYLPLPLQEALGKPYVFPSDYGKDRAPIPTSGSVTRMPEFFKDLKEQAGEKVIVVQHTEGEEVSGTVHEGEELHGGKTWEELDHPQREAWKRKLASAGHWTEDFGETIFKGVMFGEIAGAVGQAVAG
ncbi:hypothetical protein D0Z07_5118 [Hyphodiscus hymeniophilus]|uniref:Guanine nucleotide-exchange factor SEC12 n=1 Tax=Hyphodiscus hymeniophilus TaxID=353542 RepID=A0A9P6VI69_9HELO|nr:hypothetical protein D0Z07_5118 [Hyphodiscus hymeniophilus]